MQRYSIVLFKNKVKKKIIKKFVSLENANKFFEKLKSDSNQVVFETKIENTCEVKYDLALVDSTPSEFNQIYLQDEYGRNIKVKLENNKQSIIKIIEFKQEEFIFDLQKKVKINFEKLMTNYLRNQNLKLVFTLNNKIIIQEDEEMNLFSLKNKLESERFLEVLSNYFLLNRRTDCLFIKDDSKPQKKYLYKLLEDKGWDKKILYRTFTTFQAR